MRRIIKKFSFHTFGIIALFFVLVALLDNKNILIVTASSDSVHPLSMEMYYTNSGQPFSDDKKSYVVKRKGNTYYLLLPNLKEIEYARLDPARHKRKIFIHKDMQIISNKWFNTTVRTADIRKSEPIQQIADIQINQQGMHFRTTGRDPQLNINLTPVKTYTFKNFHADTFLITLLVYMVILFLYNLYKKETFSEKLVAKLILYALFLGFGLFKADYYKQHVHFNYTPDAIAHLSYIDYIHKHHDLLPPFEDMYMITNKNAGNYLGHPSLYYHLMNLFYDDHLSINGNVENFRNINIIIFATGLLLLLYLGFQANISLLGHFAYLTFITSLPMHAYLGSTLSNDNLAILGGIIFAVGFLKLLRQEFTNSTYFIVGLGIFTAFFGKLTAALLIFFTLILYFLYIWRKGEKIVISKTQILLLGVFILPTILYQAYILIHYHAIVPTLNVTHPQEYKHSVYYIPEALRVHKTPWEWLKIYWYYIHTGWFGIHSHYSFYKFSMLYYAGLFILHIFALVALFFQCRNTADEKYCLLGKLTLVALFLVAAVQVIFSYKVHLHSGYTGGMQTRYLLPFMFSFAIMASVFVDRFKNSFLFTVMIILICIQTLYSDFFYFLEHYA